MEIGEEFCWETGQQVDKHNNRLDIKITCEEKMQQVAEDSSLAYVE